MANVFDLAARLCLDSSQFESGLANASKKANDFGSAISRSIKGITNAFASIGSGVSKMTSSFVQAASATAEYGDNIDKMSQKIGISAQAYQEWSAVMQHSGTSIDVMQQGMKTLSNAVVEGSEKSVAAFRAIGLSMDQVRNMSQEDLFAAVIYGLQGMEAGAKRTAVAAQLLGRGATEMGALLNTSAHETQAMIQTVHQLNGVMSDEAVAAAARYQDSLQDMNTALSGFKNNLMAQFLPAISQVMDGLAQIFSGNSGQGLGMVREGIQQFAQSLQQVLPTFVQLGGQIVQGLAQAISENLPQLLESAQYIITTLMDGVRQYFPQLIDAAAAIIREFATALHENGPIISDAIRELIPFVSQAFQDILPDLLALLSELVIQVANGLSDCIPQITEAINTTFDTLFPIISDTLERYGPQMGEAILRMIGNAVKGIGSSIARMGETLFSKMFGWLGIGTEGAFAQYDADIQAEGEHMARSFAVGYGRGMETSMPQAISGSLSSTQASFEQFSTTAEQAGTGGGHAFSQGYGRTATEGLQTAVTQTESTMQTSFQQIATTAEQAGQATGQAYGTGMQQIDNATEQTMQSVTADFTQSCESINTAMQNVDSSTLSHLNNMVSQFVNAGNSFADAMRQSGSAMVQAIDQALGQMGQEVNAQMAHTLDTIRHMGSQMVDAFKTIGSQMVQGMIAGIKSGESALSAAINQMTSAAVNQAKAGLDIHSPSRVFRDQVGKQITAGIAEGISANAFMPMRSIDSLNGNMVAAAGVGGGDISGRLNSIYGMLETYLPNMGGDLYMDGDKIGEKMMNRMDRLMGMKAVRRQRGGTR